MIDKWTKKYLKLAKTLAEDNTSCYSRTIGVVLVSEENRIISLGYNGSVSGAPHCDDPKFLDVWYDKIIDDTDKLLISLKYDNCDTKDKFIDCFKNKKQCPRRILNIPSGQRLELCNCAHAERNALASANLSGTCTKNSVLYCWCGVPCWECSQQIIQAGVKKVICLKRDVDYSVSSRYFLEMAGVTLEILDQELVLKEI
jgi:deoxycytidylate deaminase